MISPIHNTLPLWWLLFVLVLLRWFHAVASDPGRQAGDSELGLESNEGKMGGPIARRPGTLTSSPTLEM